MKRRIIINEQFSVVEDSNCFILQRIRYSEKTDKFTWYTIGYYGNVSQCLIALINRMPIKDIEGLETYVKRIEEACDAMCAKVSDFLKG